MTSDEFRLSRPGLELHARLAPWDSEPFGFPVGEITHIEVLAQESAALEINTFWEWASRKDLGIISCRLPEHCLSQTMFLEAQGFRFIEMVLRPRFENPGAWPAPERLLMVQPASEADVPVMQAIVANAFSHERYHVDPRLNHQLADRRYCRWVENSFRHPSQRLIKILDGADIVGVFIIEERADGETYWHLTAIAPQFQGQGYGRLVWLTMLDYHLPRGGKRVTTTISARNIRVLNLYSRLNARFLPPKMTFHWVKEQMNQL